VWPAVAGPLVFTAGWLTGPLWHPGYDPLRDSVSRLALGGRGWVQVLCFVALAAGTVALARALILQVEGTGRSAAAGTTLLVVFAAATLGAAAFSLESNPVAHGVASVVAFVSMPVGLFMLGVAFGGVPGWAEFRRFTLGTALASSVLLLLLALAPSGLSQKLFLLSWTPWLVQAGRRAARNR
jgi:hypothetical protein